MKISTSPASTRTSRRIPRSATVRTGISGSTTAAAQFHARERSLVSLEAAEAGAVGAASPSRIGIGPLQKLHLGEHMAEVLRMASVASARLHPFVCWNFEICLGEDRIERVLPVRP